MKSINGIKINMKLDENIVLSGVKKKYIAKELGVDPNTLSGWLRGRRPITFENAILISMLIERDLNDLFEVIRE